MKKGHIILALALSLFSVQLTVAQSDENQAPAPSPAPAFGQENPAPTVSENPPISAIDQPGLDPHAAPQSFLLPGLHFSESVDSNVANSLGGSSIGLVTRGLGSLTLQRLWKNYDVAMDYIGGAAYYGRTGVGLEQMQQLDLDNRINWKRGQLAIRDSFSYLPEGTFSSGAYGGAGAYNIGLGSLGAGMLGAGAFGGQTSAFAGGNDISVGQVPRLTNLGMADVVEELTPKSSVTMAAGYGLVHFYGDLNSTETGTNENIDFIGSREFTGQAAYDRVLTPKDQVALSYGYQGFDFSIVGTAFHSNVIQAMYGHRISGRMDFLISAGPQFTHISSSPLCTFMGTALPIPPDQCILGNGVNLTPQQANHLGVAGRFSLRYRFPKTTVSLTFQRYETSGSGIYAGSQSNIAHLDLRRPLSRVWEVFSNAGYSKNDRLQLAGSTVNASSFTSGFGGVGLHRQINRSLRAFVSYQFNELGFNTDLCPTGSALSAGVCEAPGGVVSSKPTTNLSQRQVGSIGVDWSPRPIRLD